MLSMTLCVSVKYSLLYIGFSMIPDSGYNGSPSIRKFHTNGPELPREMEQRSQ